jgi:hypothetical protein
MRIGRYRYSKISPLFIPQQGIRVVVWMQGLFHEQNFSDAHIIYTSLALILQYDIAHERH